MKQILGAEARGDEFHGISSTRTLFGIKSHAEEVIERVTEWAVETTMSFKTLMSYYRCALMDIETKFKVLNEEFSVDSETNPVESIKTRIKSPDSLFEKL